MLGGYLNQFSSMEPESFRNLAASIQATSDPELKLRALNNLSNWAKSHQLASKDMLVNELAFGKLMAYIDIKGVSPDMLQSRMGEVGTLTPEQFETIRKRMSELPLAPDAKQQAMDQLRDKKLAYFTDMLRNRQISVDQFATEVRKIPQISPRGFQESIMKLYTADGLNRYRGISELSKWVQNRIPDQAATYYGQVKPVIEKADINEALYSGKLGSAPLEKRISPEAFKSYVTELAKYSGVDDSSRLALNRLAVWSQKSNLLNDQRYVAGIDKILKESVYDGAIDELLQKKITVQQFQQKLAGVENLSPPAIKKLTSKLHNSNLDNQTRNDALKYFSKAVAANQNFGKNTQAYQQKLGADEYSKMLSEVKSKNARALFARENTKSGASTSPSLKRASTIKSISSSIRSRIFAR